MAIDAVTPESYEELRQLVAQLQQSLDQSQQVVADLQRSVDQNLQKNSLLELALLNTIRGRWDAAQHGVESAEAALVARNPGLHGKVHAIPFDVAR